MELNRRKSIELKNLSIESTDLTSMISPDEVKQENIPEIENEVKTVDWVDEYENAFKRGDVKRLFEAAGNITKQKIEDIAFERLLAVANNKDMTSEGEIDFRTMTIELIGKFKDERAFNELKNIADNEEQLVGIRAYAVQQMRGASQDDKIFNYLVLQLKNPEPLIRSIAAFRLGIGEPGNAKAGPYLMPLLNDEDSRVRNRTIRALGAIKYKGAVNELIQKLIVDDKGKDLNEKVIKGVAAEALGQIGDERAIEPLIAILLDKSRERFVRTTTIKALTNFKDDRVVTALIKVTKEDSSIGYHAATGLAELGDIRTADVIAEAIRNEKDSYALGKLKEAYKRLRGVDYNEEK